ncbi:MAG: MBG domain-containing protein [Eubacteriales bacterium]|nr:MBG domain-containing protein [Eubacteriales bacterium]
MNKNQQKFRRYLCILLAILLVFTMIPVNGNGTVSAAELFSDSEATAEIPEISAPENEIGESEEMLSPDALFSSGQEETTEFKEEEGSFGAGTCSPEEVQEMISALPSVEEISVMEEENRLAAYEQVQAAYDAWLSLTEEEQAEIEEAEAVFEELFAYFNSQVILLDAGDGTCWTDGLSAQPDGYTVSEDGNTITITTAEGLAWLAVLVNDANGQTRDNFKDKTVKLDADIDLSGKMWTPIGVYNTSMSNSFPFSGTFDGNGHTISNMTVESDSLKAVGLFGYTSQSEIKNLTLMTPSVNQKVSGNVYAGGVVGYAVSSKGISACAVVNGEISAEGTKETNVGGIVGYANSVTAVSVCYNQNTKVTTTASGTVYRGGVVGYERSKSPLSSYSYVPEDRSLKVCGGRFSGQYCAYLGETETDRTAGASGGERSFSEEQFSDGTVAYFLRTGFYSNVSYEIWGQKVGTDSLPGWNSEENVDCLDYICKVDGTYKRVFIYFNALSQNEAGAYLIKDAVDWAAFVKLVKKDGKTDADAEVQENAVIDFSQFGTLMNFSTYSYMMIADPYTSASYTGTFNGNGCTIRGVRFDGTSQFALFGNIGEGGTVRGINLESPEIASTGANVAGIACYSYGTIEDCHVKGGSITSSSGPVAGIAANGYGVIRGCTNSADITALSNVGGIVGSSTSGTGATSADNPLIIERCSNSGNITATQIVYNNYWSYAGGIFGGRGMFNRSQPYFKINCCYNTGNITGVGYIGGTAGYSYGDKYAEITNCYNTGTIGALDTTITHAAGISGCSGTVKNCYNTGLVYGSTYAQPIKATGEQTFSSNINSYALENCVITNYTGTLYYGSEDGNQANNTKGKRTAEQFVSGEVAYQLQNGQDDPTTQVWSQEIGQDASPVLESTYPVVQITVYLIDENGGDSRVLAYCYANAGSTLKEYPSDDTVLYTFYSDQECTTEINTATQTYSADTDIYAKQTEKTELTITGVTVTGAEKEYDGNPVSYSGTPQATDKNDTEVPGLEYTYTWYRVEDSGTTVLLSKVPSDAGSYKLVVTPDNGQYIGKQEILFTIKPRKIENAQVSASGEYTYNGQAQKPTITVVLPGDPELTDEDYDLTYSNSNGGEGNLINAGTVTATVTFKGNYSGTVTGTFEIKKSVLTIQSAEITKKIYDGKTAAKVSGLTWNGLMNQDTLTEGTDYMVSALYDSAGAGDNHTVTVTVTLQDTAKAGNYQIAPSYSYECTGQTIEKAQLTIKANDNAIIYGDEPAGAGVAYTGFVNGETESVLTGQLSYSYNYQQFGNTGNYTITPEGITSENYAIAFEDGTLTVEPREVSLTWNNTEDRTYNDGKGDITATAGNLVNDDEIGVTVSGGETDNKNASDTPYTAKATGLTGDKVSNYKLPENCEINYTIGKAPSRLNASESAYNLKIGESAEVSITNNSEAALSYSSDNEEVATVSKEGDKITIKAVGKGTAVITITSSETDNYQSGILTITVNVGLLTGTASVTMADWTYNETPSDPVPSSETNGTDHVTYLYKEKNSDDNSYSKEKPVNAGEYTVQATFEESGDYGTVIVTCDFKILKAELTLSVSDESFSSGSTGKVTPTLKDSKGNAVTVGQVTYTITWYRDKECKTLYGDGTAAPSSGGTYYAKVTISGFEDMNYTIDTKTAEAVSKVTISYPYYPPVTTPSPTPSPTPVPDEYPDGSTVQPDGSIQTPDGTVIRPDGTIVLPDGMELKPDEDGNKPEISKDGTVTDINGTAIKPDGTIILPGEDKESDKDNTIVEQGEGTKAPIYDPETGNVTVQDGNQVTLPDGTKVTPPAGSTVQPDGSIRTPDGTTTKPDGTVIDPDGTTSKPDGTVIDPDGTTTKPDGTVIDPDGTIHNTDGSVQSADGTYLRPATPWLESAEVFATGNQVRAVLSGPAAGAEGYDYVISKNINCIRDKDYLAVSKNILLTKTDFRYIPKGTYYVYCHAWIRGADGKKVFGNWSNYKTVTVTATTPATPKITGVKVKGSTVSVTYTQCKAAAGYDVVLGKAARKVYGELRPVNYGTLVKKVKNGKTVTVTFKNVKAGTYYAGLHAWNRTSTDGKKVFSPWSNVRKIVVK